ncbi:thiosulfate/3-mercaptopyruvate sulfurtransferase [Rhodococcus sp. 27YEA15]|uniref:sulfurtransferase n=1 Tax=Rhodococcus sp. 27YEA15 TaxID=3156259 RepID=UPI003C7D1697
MESAGDPILVTAGKSPLVDAAWLREHGADPSLIVFDATVSKTADGEYVSGRTSFAENGHIPGSRHADLIADFSDPDAPTPFMRPRPQALEAVARTHGIGSHSTVVAYDCRGGAWAARLWWLLRAYGHDDVRVLDGGLQSWIAAGGEMEFDDPAPAAVGDFRTEVRGGYFVDTAEVRALTESSLLVCGLGREVFDGREPVAGRRGHIPGSVNVPYLELLDAQGRVDPDRVRARFGPLTQHRQLTQHRPVVGYCGGGINAAGLALALSVAGFTDVQVYDGSLSEWNADPRNPLRYGDTQITVRPD